MYSSIFIALLWVLFNKSYAFNVERNSSRILSIDDYCDKDTENNALLTRYFNSMKNIYGKSAEGTCFPVHQKCGWPKSENRKKLPLFVLSVGLEGAGHHLWTEILDQPVFDCVWINARHYMRDVGDGVPRTSVGLLRSGFLEQFKARADTGKPPCKRIYDAEDSFPTGAIRKSGRVFMRPDIVNLQKLDGVLFDVKYLIIVRNTTVSVSVYITSFCFTLIFVSKGYGVISLEKKFLQFSRSRIAYCGTHSNLHGICT